MNTQDAPVFEALTEIYLMALCIWAEARNQGLEGMQAVGSVILNRASSPGWWGHDIKSVILAPKQFSWLLSSDQQYTRCAEIAKNFIDRLETDANLRAAWWVAKGLIEKWPECHGTAALKSNVAAATLYHTQQMNPFPAWAAKSKKVCQIKDHIFYE